VLPEECCQAGRHNSSHNKRLELAGQTQTPPFFVGYKGGKIYWPAIHSNQANLIVGGLRQKKKKKRGYRVCSSGYAATDTS
jgi:hypothetical protein